MTYGSEDDFAYKLSKLNKTYFPSTSKGEKSVTPDYYKPALYQLS